MGDQHFYIAADLRKTLYVPSTLEAKGPKGHSSLSATPFHSLPLSDGLPQSICHS